MRTFFSQRVLTKVVRPVPEAPQTIRQNWMPFFTFFLRRSFGPGIEDMLADGEVMSGGDKGLAAICC